MSPPKPFLSTSTGLDSAIASLLARRLPDGGFAETGGGDYRSDATAWAILCLDSFRTQPEITASARARLAASQLANGCIPLAPDYPEASWPTATAALALQGIPQFATAHAKSINFLLATVGEKIPKDPGNHVGHDGMIPGWSWIDRTHSWVEPTALAIRALVCAGKPAHERVHAGVRLLLDRQLPGGGWNYGNTTVFGKILRPMPASTGVALWALAGLTERKSVAASLDLLGGRLDGLSTPLSLGWALKGLGAWDITVRDADRLIADCLQRQGRYAQYGTSQLAILLTAAATLTSAEGRHA